MLNFFDILSIERFSVTLMTLIRTSRGAIDHCYCQFLRRSVSTKALSCIFTGLRRQYTYLTFLLMVFLSEFRNVEQFGNARMIPTGEYSRLYVQPRRSEHIKDALASLHWLRVPERILSKVAVLTRRAVNGSAPEYLSSYTSPGSPTCPPYCGFDHLILTDLWCHSTISLPSASGPSQSSPPIFGIGFP